MDNIVMKKSDSFLRKQYLKYLFPIMFSVLGGTINALVDSILVSQKLGTDGLAAVNMCMPIYLVLCTMGSLIAGGGQVLSAQSMGRNDVESANQFFHTALLLGISFGIGITGLGILLIRPIASLLAQGGRLENLVFEYSLVSLIGAIFFLLMYLPLFYLQLEGRTSAITLMVIIMITIDVICDFLFMYIIEWGLYGAALASVISAACACFFGFYILMKKHANYAFHRNLLKFIQVPTIFKVGSPFALGNFYDAIRLLFLNAIILHAGGESAIAIWAILNIIAELSLSISTGVPQAAAPMTSVYYAAGENSGVRILVRLQNQIGIAISIIFTLFLTGFHSLIEKIFGIDQTLLFPLFYLGISIIANVIGSIWTTLFNVTNKIMLSNFLTILRRLICPVVAVYFLSFSNYLWLFLSTGSILALLISFAGVITMAHKSKTDKYPLSTYLLLDDHLEREHKIIDFSICAKMDDACTASEQIQGFCKENHVDPKKTIRISLSIEELIQTLIDQIPDAENFDLRVYALSDVTGIQIRCIGKKYNPFEQVDEDDPAYMGILMLKKLAQDIRYTYTLGMNTFNITFD